MIKNLHDKLNEYERIARESGNSETLKVVLARKDKIDK